ncbi:MAG: pyridoxal phosphate-dependent aminotransferase [Chlorobi bacterium]|nr:pyridoxal phosphate-dependent aminotransferase [Chlorobiota bacterium]
MKISKRAQNITPSATMRISALAKEMNRRGERVISLSMGEPDFPTPENIKNAAAEAIKNNKTKYTVNSGIPELREAVAAKFKNDNALDYSSDEIIVSNGAKHSLYNALLSIIDEGDEVLIPAPYWVSYPHMVNLAQGKPVIIDSREENGFKISAEDLESKITDRTAAIIFCNPSNPTGAAYSKSEIERLTEIFIEKNIIVIADEIYEKLVFNGFEFISVASLNEKIKSQTIVVNGVSKAYSMTGWRIGYAAGPKEVISAMGRIQSHSTSNASSISQYAALEALRGPQNEVENMRAEFEKRRDYFQKEINGVEGINCNLPQGAFYLFPNVSSYFSEEIKGSTEFAAYLLEKGKVATVPGAAFGMEGFVRLSYAASMEELEEAAKRIKSALADLRKS